jgi:hypothetical protein
VILKRILEAAEGERLIPVNPERKVRAPKRSVDPEVVCSRVGRRAYTQRSSAGSWSPARPSTATTSSDASIRPVPMGEPVAAMPQVCHPHHGTHHRNLA